MSNNYYVISDETIRAIQERFMQEREDKMMPGELDKQMNEKCSRCKEYFTRTDILTGDRMCNEYGHLFHMGCYNEWCEENPFKSNQSQASEI